MPYGLIGEGTGIARIHTFSRVRGTHTRTRGRTGRHGELYSCCSIRLRPYSPSNGFRFQTTSWNMSMPAQSADRPMPAPFSDYEIDAAYDEMFRARGRPRPHYKNLYTQLLNLPSEELHRSKKEADLSFFNQGITFTVYGRAEGTEQIFPHDLLPRIITSSEWATIERGLTQRITALNFVPGRRLSRSAAS